ncbi:hypothetical protein J7E79_15650 [Bacillus sp. ISL-40]|uniref:hypothetical protein n=1 Tax=unclassified Bacillus (in: firmicutes) TaxID=185979 RepID=UPI001BE6DE68|nr:MULTISPECIES: hypothetical protein [unclassified Bacillus (in: firmicutes)]MBT2698833.1 hypothetical protein [Bacillus sp. ISL-40]MBT2720722.1 hypothetical protein [Bacillus sp. ISL-46]MBT2741003.1 hypothetical protein [Bacillus sp. ISL-77]
MSIEDVISIGANCIVQIRNRFFLLVEIEVEAGNVAFEEFVFIRISRQEARTLLDAGVNRCEITTRVPRSDDVEVEFICILIVDGEAFAVFDVENNTDEAVLVEIPLAAARRLIRRGARECTVIDRLRD